MIIAGRVRQLRPSEDGNLPPNPSVATLEIESAGDLVLVVCALHRLPSLCLEDRWVCVSVRPRTLQIHRDMRIEITYDADDNLVTVLPSSLITPLAGYS